MSNDVTGHDAFPADGYDAAWSTGEHRHELTLRWDNEAWTASCRLERESAEYVLRITPMWQVSQFLLFRDLPEADLWLGTDGGGRWGEVNGAHRVDLDGATDITLGGSPFSHTVPVRRLPLRVGEAAELSVLQIDIETLGVVSHPATYERHGDRLWRYTSQGETIDFAVDQFGVPIDFGEYTRS